MKWRCVLAFVAFVWLLLIAASCPLMNSNPVAQFSCSPSSGEAPLTVEFDGAQSYDSDGEIATYKWNLGEGTIRVGATTSHTYSAQGTYTVQLTVKDDAGGSNTAYALVTVAAPVPGSSSPTYRVTVSQILSEFEVNEYAAEMKYQEQVIAVSGYVQRIGIDMLDKPLVVLTEQPGASSFADSVICKFPVGYHPGLAQLVPDDFVTVIGEYNIYGLGNVYLRNSYLE